LECENCFPVNSRLLKLLISNQPEASDNCR
jgi:hypothetical protein